MSLWRRVWVGALAIAGASGAIAACSADDAGGTPGAADSGTDGGGARDGTTGDGASSDAGPPDGALVVQILAFNDFHGNLRPPGPGNAVVVALPDDPTVGEAGAPQPTDAGTVEGGPLNVQVYAGGAAYLAAHIRALRAENPNTLVVSAGDVTGASPLVSSLYDDEPTVDVMNAIGVDYTSVGNHEFDRGAAEILRKQYGGCKGDKTDAGGSCFADPSFGGAKYEYLAANVDVVDASAAHVGDASLGTVGSAETLFPPYAIESVGGAKIALIGMTLEGTASIVSSAGTAGLSFQDETATVNQLVPLLKSQGVDAIVVLVHQGGFNAGTYDDCVGFTGGTAPAGQHDIAYIADNLDPAVDVVASAHTHVAYNCTRPNGRILTQAASYGRVLTKIELTIDTAAHAVTAKRAKNVIVTRDVAPDPAVQALVDKYVALAAPIAERPVGYVSADIPKLPGANGETPLGDLVADAYQAASGADVAFINVGGIRDSLLFKQYYAEGDGTVTFEKAQAVLPFTNKLETLGCKGQDILDALQQNVYVQPGGGTKLLQPSSALTFSWSASKADAHGQNAADPASVRINGAALDPAATYVVGVADFVAGGGDGYTAFQACALRSVIGSDLDAFLGFLGQSTPSAPLAPPPATRITLTP